MVKKMSNGGLKCFKMLYHSLESLNAENPQIDMLNSLHVMRNTGIELQNGDHLSSAEIDRDMVMI